MPLTALPFCIFVKWIQRTWTSFESFVTNAVLPFNIEPSITVFFRPRIVTLEGIIILFFKRYVRFPSHMIPPVFSNFFVACSNALTLFACTLLRFACACTGSNNNINTPRPAMIPKGTHRLLTSFTPSISGCGL